MKRLRLKEGVAGADVGLATALMEAIGSDDFAGRLLESVGKALAASHCTIFALRGDGRIDAISTASGIGQVASQVAREYLRRGYGRQDSNMQWLVTRRPSATRRFWLSHQYAQDVADEAYRRLCYGETGIRERLSLLTLFPDGHRTAVSLYRTHSFPDYCQADLDWLGRQATVVATALMQHVRLTGIGRLSDPVRDDRMAHLPVRERELVSHVLAGLTTREAADRMGVALTTALTYRYRAFHRLGIRNHRDLMALVVTP